MGTVSCTRVRPCEISTWRRVLPSGLVCPASDRMPSATPLSFLGESTRRAFIACENLGELAKAATSFSFAATIAATFFSSALAIALRS